MCKQTGIRTSQTRVIGYNNTKNNVMNKSLLDLIELPTLAVAHTRNTTQFRGCYDNVPILYYYLNCTWMFETNLFIPWVVVSCIAWHILELVVRLISYRLSVFKSIEDKNDSLRWHNKYVDISLGC